MSNPYALDFSPIAALGQQAYQVGTAERSAALENKRFNILAEQEKRAAETQALNMKVAQYAFDQKVKEDTFLNQEVDMATSPIYTKASPSMQKEIRNMAPNYGARVTDEGQIFIPRRYYKAFIEEVERTPDMFEKLSKAAMLDAYTDYMAKQAAYENAKEALKKKIASTPMSSLERKRYEEELKQKELEVHEALKAYNDKVSASSLGMKRTEIRSMIHYFQNHPDPKGSGKTMWDALFTPEIQRAMMLSEQTGNMEYVNEAVKASLKEKMKFVNAGDRVIVYQGDSIIGTIPVGAPPKQFAPTRPVYQIWVKADDPSKTMSVDVTNEEEKRIAIERGYQPYVNQKQKVTLPGGEDNDWLGNVLKQIK